MTTKAKRRMRSWSRLAWTLAWRTMRKETKDRALMAYKNRPGANFGCSRGMDAYYNAAGMALYYRELDAGLKERYGEGCISLFARKC